MTKDCHYTLRRGESGADRLELLGEAMWPTTKRFFERAALPAGARCLDMGCGVGVVSREIAKLTGHCLGVDPDREFIERARNGSSLPGLEYQTGSLFEFDGLESFDVVYCRYLLSHLGNPGHTMKRLVEFLKSGGTLLIEDVDFPMHFHHPPSVAFGRYLELYQAIVSRNGGNPRIGRELLPTALSLELQGIDIECVVSVHHQGPSKKVAELTLAHISRALIEAELISEGELSSLLAELKAYRREPSTQISIAPTFQLFARKTVVSLGADDGV